MIDSYSFTPENQNKEVKNAQSLHRLSAILGATLALPNQEEETTPLSAFQHGDILLFDGCSTRSSIVRFLQLN
jgi:hypothetical protein